MVRTERFVHVVGYLLQFSLLVVIFCVLGHFPAPFFR